MGKHPKTLAFSDTVTINTGANPFHPDGLTVSLMYVFANQLSTECHQPEVETWVSFITTVCLQFRSLLLFEVLNLNRLQPSIKAGHKCNVKSERLLGT
jgi:hypothetical protein